MCTVIALLSGKGGSGKTTLALSMSDLFQKCGIRTLLIDCDMSTNGATYFYEAKLNSQDQATANDFLSFDRLLSQKNCEITPSFFQLDNNLDFVPSVAHISGEAMGMKSTLTRRELTNRLGDFLTMAREHYEVILFDCQAGYTEILPALLPHVDADLFVLEADSISASAMRSLHLKIGNFVGNARLYQVFNKATQEEFEIYSKIVGTFFVNIGTLLFDWKIRQAFSRAIIPDVENTSAKYGIDLCDISAVVLNNETIREKLSVFSKRLRIRQLQEKRKQLEDRMFATKKKASQSIRFITTICLASITAIVGVLFSAKVETILQSEKISLGIIVMAFCALLASIVNITLDSHGSRTESRVKSEREIRDIDKEILMLNKVLMANDAEEKKNQSISK